MLWHLVTERQQGTQTSKPARQSSSDGGPALPWCLRQRRSTIARLHANAHTGSSHQIWLAFEIKYAGRGGSNYSPTAADWNRLLSDHISSVLRSTFRQCRPQYLSSVQILPRAMMVASTAFPRDDGFGSGWATTLSVQAATYRPPGALPGSVSFRRPKRHNSTCSTQACVDGSLFPLPQQPADRHPVGDVSPLRTR